MPTAKTKSDSLQWQQVKPDDMNYLLIEETKMTMKTHLRPNNVALWNLHIPALVNKAVSLARSEASFFGFRDNITLAFFGLSLFLIVVILCLIICITHGARKNDRYRRLLRGNSTSSNYPVNL